MNLKGIKSCLKKNAKEPIEKHVIFIRRLWEVVKPTDKFDLNFVNKQEAKKKCGIYKK